MTKTCSDSLMVGNLLVLTGELRKLKHDMRAAQRAAYAAGSINNMKCQWKAFYLFCLHFRCSPIPASLETMCLYAQFLSRSFQSVDTIRSYLSGVKQLHLFSGAMTVPSQWRICFETDPSGITEHVTTSPSPGCADHARNSFGILSPAEPFQAARCHRVVPVSVCLFPNGSQFKFGTQVRVCVRSKQAAPSPGHLQYIGIAVSCVEMVQN